MEIQILQTTTLAASGSNYKTFHLACEKKEISVTVVCGRNCYIKVIVMNASHNVWKGLGKDFKTFEEAFNNYKCPKIKAMINFVKSM